MKRVLYDVLNEYEEKWSDRRVEIMLRVGSKVFTICKGFPKVLLILLDCEIFSLEVGIIVDDLDETKTDAILIRG